jgi:hypothetical protein
MIYSGRFFGYRGELSVEQDGVQTNGRRAIKILQQATALPDAPTIDEPDQFAKVWRIAQEGFAFAGVRKSKRETLDYLSQYVDGDKKSLAKLNMQNLPGQARIAMSTELAFLRPGVELVFWIRPERFGATPQEWYQTLRKFNTSGHTIILITSKYFAESIGLDYFDLDTGERKPIKTSKKSRGKK